MSNEAKARRHDFIGTEHLLLGIIHERAGIGARALVVLGISPQQVVESVDAVVGPGNTEPPDQVPMTPRSKDALNHAFKVSLEFGDDHIATEHLLLGLLRQTSGAAARVLRQFGVDEGSVRAEVLRERAGEETVSHASGGATGPDPTAHRRRRLLPPPRRLRSIIQGGAAVKRAVKLEEENALEEAIGKYRWAIEVGKYHPDTGFWARTCLVGLYQKNGRDAEAIPVLRDIAAAVKDVERYTVLTIGMLGLRGRSSRHRVAAVAARRNTRR